MSYKKKIWIDLDNSPHVPFFKPIIDELNKRGYSTVLTARDCFQVCGLADLLNLDYKCIGHHYGGNVILKVFGLLFRSLQLIPIVLEKKPDLAISHGSRSQLIVAYISRIPSILIFDYEYTKSLPGIYPTYVIVPDIVSVESVKHPKFDNIIKYPGIKEDVYVPFFKQDPIMAEELGLSNEDIVITVRPPATEAHYHNPESEELFKAAIDFLSRIDDVRLVLLPRNEKQIAEVREIWPAMCKSKKILIPDHVIEGLNLIWHSDLVISGGGTMNREAAALGVPVYSIFRGKIGAVDRFLADTGRLILLESVEDVQRKIVIKKRHRPENPEHINHASLRSIVDSIIKIIESTQ